MENSDLQLSKITITPKEPLHLDLISETISTNFVLKIPVKEISKKHSLDEALLHFESEEEKTAAKIIYTAVQNSELLGLSENEILVIFFKGIFYI